MKTKTEKKPSEDNFHLKIAERLNKSKGKWTNIPTHWLRLPEKKNNGYWTVIKGSGDEYEWIVLENSIRAHLARASKATRTMRELDSSINQIKSLVIDSL